MVVLTTNDTTLMRPMRHRSQLAHCAFLDAGPVDLIAPDADDDAVVLGGGDGAAERAAGVSHLKSPNELSCDRVAEPTGACHF